LNSILIFVKGCTGGRPLQRFLLISLIPLFYFGTFALYEHAYLTPALHRSERLADDARDFRPAINTPEIGVGIGSSLDMQRELNNEAPDRRPAMNGPGWNLLVGMHAPTNGFLTRYISDTYFYRIAGDQTLTARQVQQQFMLQAIIFAEQNIQNGSMPRLLWNKTRYTWGSDDWAVGWVARFDTPGVISVTRIERPLRFISDAYYFIILIPAIVALMLWLVRKKFRKLLSPVLPLVTVLIGMFMLSLLVETHPRYTFPANALLILTSASLLTLINKPKKIPEEPLCNKLAESSTN